jgi:hypothetical protein
MLVQIREAEKSSNQFPTIDRSSVRQQVFQAMKKKAGLKADKIICEHPITVNSNTPPLEIDLLTERHTGAILSAWYATAASIETGFLRGFLDIECYLNNHQSHGGLFMLRPTEYPGIDAKNLEKIDIMIDKLMWKAETSGFTVSAESSADAVADNIFEWAQT